MSGLFIGIGLALLGMYIKDAAIVVTKAFVFGEKHEDED